MFAHVNETEDKGEFCSKRSSDKESVSCTTLLLFCKNDEFNIDVCEEELDGFSTTCGGFTEDF